MEKNRGIDTGNLNIGYGSDLIRDISLSVKPGEIVTLIGPNGCGKTTLLRTVTGLLKDRGGTVFLCGDDKSLLKSSEIARRMSAVFTHRSRPELMTCREVVEVGRYPYTGSLGILSEKDRSIVAKAMQWTGVSELEDVLFDNISDGQKQRVLLARAISQEPQILILDEPTSFLDIRHKLRLLQMITDYARKKKVAILISLHELEIARSISDTVVALGEGRVLAMGKPDQVFREDFIRRLYDIGDMDVSLLGGLPWKEIKKQTDAEGSFENDKGFGQNRIPRSSLKKNGVIMIQGTMSNAGKSVITAGLCRIFSDDGFRVAPFKSQNMALNSYITREGLEMGRAQVMQAECARTEPLSIMNPVLLKPTSDTGSQVILNGQVIGNMSASEYMRRKMEFAGEVIEAYERLRRDFDIIVIEGAGSPAEMNLKKDDIVNMGLAKMVDAPVLLVGDIDRGGVFAQLIGTVDLLEEEERNRIRGLIVNKFRGDKALFEEGVRILEDRSGIRVAGVVPYLDISLDDEDSLSGKFERKEVRDIDIAVIRLKHLSNYTDFDPFGQSGCVSVRYVSKPEDLGSPDLIILPGSKNTIADLRIIRENGICDAIVQKAEEGTCVMGICGGYQMLGLSISDPDIAENGGTERGLGLLPVKTVLEKEKVTVNVKRSITGATGLLSDLGGTAIEGYEIHMGRTLPVGELTEFTSEKTGYCKGNVYGTYVHGFFDKKEILVKILGALSKAAGKKVSTDRILDQSDYRDGQYDILAKALKKSLDIDYIYEVMGIER